MNCRYADLPQPPVWGTPPIQFIAVCANYISEISWMKKGLELDNNAAIGPSFQAFPKIYGIGKMYPTCLKA